MFKKTLAIAAVAMFCISSFVVMAESDESAATDSTLTYSFYLELKDGSSSLSKRLPDVEVAGTEPSSALYKEALTAALTAVGYTFEYSSPTSKMLVSLNDGEHTYAKTGTFQTDGYKTFSVAHYDNGWKPSSLGESTAYVISYNEYKFTAPTGDEVGKQKEGHVQHADHDEGGGEGKVGGHVLLGVARGCLGHGDAPLVRLRVGVRLVLVEERMVALMIAFISVLVRRLSVFILMVRRCRLRMEQ